MMNKEKKQSIIEKFRINAQDTGSVELQVALLTERINELNKHFESFPKDEASRTGLMKMVGRRRTYLDYIKRNNQGTYEDLISRLGLRK